VKKVVSKTKRLRDQGCLEIKGAKSPLHGEDLDRLNRGSSVHFVWATELNKIGRSKAQQTTPYQCSHPIFYIHCLAGSQCKNVAHIGKDVVILRYATKKTGNVNVNLLCHHASYSLMAADVYMCREC